VTAIDGDDTIVAPDVPSAERPTGSQRASRIRREQHADRSKRRARRLSMLSIGVLVGVASWVTLGHSDPLDPAVLRASTDIEIVSASTTLRPTQKRSSSTGPLDEVGGLITGSPGLSVSATTTSIDNRLLVIGDSVMQGAAPYLADKLPKWSVIADTKVGRFLDEATRVVKRRSAQDLGEFVVLNLGNNYGGDPVDFRQQINDMMTELTSVKHVVWVNMGEFEPAQEEVNAELRSALDRYPNLVVADWSRLWESHPEYTSSDDLHLTDTGPDAYAQLVADAVTRIVETAGEVPAKGAQKAKISTKGEIPASKRKTSPSRSRASTTVDTTIDSIIDELNRPGSDIVPTEPEVTSPPDTAPAPSTSSP